MPFWVEKEIRENGIAKAMEVVMKNVRRKWKKFSALALAVVLMGTSTNVTAFAARICDHHLEHTPGCGYVEAVEGVDCTHKHDDECYSEVVFCVHEHDENCGYAVGVEDSCTHTCSVESRCITTEENCNHSHDENCGYVQAVEGRPCSFVCNVCEAEASDEDDEDAVCICEDKCTADAVNEECPVCSLEEADLALCAGEEVEEVTCICTEKCVEDSVNEECPVCFAENADLNNCIGEVEEMQSIITAWSFVDEIGYIDLETNTLALPGANAENVALKEDIISLLPASIKASINDAEETLALSGWECANYPQEGAYAGSYTFTATLPEGYVLEEGVNALSVNVELGGAIVYNTRAGVCIHENPAVNNDSTINAEYVCDVCGLFGYIGSPNVYDVSWELEDNGDSTYTLRIKGTGATIAYSDWEDNWDNTERRYFGSTPWQNYRLSITQAVVQDGVTGLGNGIFAGTNIKSIDIGKDVKSIGSGAFVSCTKLESVTLPQGLTTIGSSAFNGCSAMTSCSIPNTVTEIAFRAFNDCKSLSSISLPYGLTEIIEQTFLGCSSLQTVTLAEGIESIGNFAFNSCPITSIEIPGTVTTIGNGAFYQCKELTRVQINEGVETIGYEAFAKCEKLQEVILPTTIKDIGYRAFQYCYLLESINLQGIESIGDYAFVFSGLTEVTIPGTITDIPERAFGSCDNLETVVIEQGVTSIGVKAFQLSNNIKTLRIPSSLTSVASDAFTNNAFDTIYVPCNATLNNLNSLFINTSLSFSETNGELSCNNSENVVKGTHDFSAGECNDVVSCANGCGESGTNPAGHAFDDATCTTAQTCSRCGITQGSALGHAMSPWVVVGDNHTHECLRDGCNFEETQAHNGGEATCVAKAVCSTCGTEYGDKNLNNHTFVEATCLEAKHCTRTGCDFVDGNPLPHAYEYSLRDNVIKEQCPNGCNHSESLELKVKAGANLTYSGRPITPLELVYSDGWVDSSITAEIIYENNVNVGTAKGSVTFTIGGNDYTIEKTFTIKPLITISDNDDSDDDEDDTPTWTVTIAKAEPKLPVLETYVVKAGDTLSKIAAMYGCTVNDIMQYNSTLIKNPNLIYVGWELTIPVGGIVNEPVTNTAGNALYVVQSGDTLYAIAKKYRCSVKDIVELNSKLIKNPNLIYAGWELIIPQ